MLAGYVVFAAAGLLVILSGQIRERSSLIVSGTGLGLPEQMVWPLVVLLSFGVASAMSAALHGPWWLKGDRAAVRADGDGHLVVTQRIALRLGGMADPGRRPDGGACGADHHSLASQICVVGIRRDLGAHRAGDDCRRRRDARGQGLWH